jgi:S1-C subfamily serine protease
MKSRKRLTTYCAVALLLACGFRAAAQQFPRTEVFAGYELAGVDGSLFQKNVNTVSQSEALTPPTLQGHARANGWNASAQMNVRNWLGVVFDFGGAYSKQSFTVVSTPVNQQATSSAQLYTLMAGPQLMYSNSSRFQPFLRGLGGGVIARVSGNVVANGANLLKQDIQTNETGAGFGGGGGLDVRITRRVYLRIGGDFIRSSLFGANQNNFLASTGLVFKEREREGGPRHKPAPAASPTVQTISIPELGVTGLNEASGGFRIVSIIPGSAASGSALQPGDLLVGINGKVTRQADEITDALRAQSPGAKIVVSYMRSYWQSETSITLK